MSPKHSSLEKFPTLSINFFDISISQDYFFFLFLFFFPLKQDPALHWEYAIHSLHKASIPFITSLGDSPNMIAVNMSKVDNFLPAIWDTQLRFVAHYNQITQKFRLSDHIIIYLFYESMT